MKFLMTPKQVALLQEYSRFSGNVLFENEDPAFDPFDHRDMFQHDEPVNQYGTFLKLNVKGNAKIKHPYISLPAGWSCPGAKVCKSKADPTTGKIKDGPHTQFRCYAASDESRYVKTRDQRWTNFSLLKKCGTADAMADLIMESIRHQIPLLPKVFRIHESGDFFNQEYFDAWILVARKMPETIFYTYTKAINYWSKRKSSIPDNLKLNASLGGAYDSLIFKNDFKYVEVVFSVEEAIEKRLKIDLDDSLAWRQDKSFAILLHGVQPKGSKASGALQKLKKTGHGGYSAKKKKS